jgi:hypothetical protein
MTFAGMKLQRGRYHFSPTKDTPPGVKWRYNLDSQGLLMEAARRMDEEAMLKEFLPSQAITFSPGSKVLPVERLSETGQRIMELALAGLPLGRIIRQGRTESFVARDLLKNWVQEGMLVKHNPGGEEPESEPKGPGLKLKLDTGLRSLPLTLVAVFLVAALGWLRWTAVPDPDNHSGQQLREAQLRGEVITAARLFRYQKGAWPASLNELVRAGQLAPSVKVTSEALGWKYDLNQARDTFTFGS